MLHFTIVSRLGTGEIVTSYILDQHLQLFYMPPKRLAKRFEAGEDIVSFRKKEQIGGNYYRDHEMGPFFFRWHQA